MKSTPYYLSAILSILLTMLLSDSSMAELGRNTGLINLPPSQTYSPQTDAISIAPSHHPLFPGMKGRVYGLVEQFDWDETVDNAPFVGESGERFGLGILYAWDHSPSSLITFRAEGYLGTVDYDGGLQTINPDGSVDITPATGDTGYGGARLELLWHYKLQQRGSAYGILPYIGLGYHGWNRELKGEGGYTESWNDIYLPIGVSLGGQLGNAFYWAWFADLAVAVPLFTDEQFNDGTRSVEPEPQIGYVAELGLRRSRLSASVYYRDFSFEASPVNRDGVYQPESEANTLGLRIGWEF